MVDAIFMHLNASAPEMSESKTMQNIATSVVERFLCRVPKALRIHTYVIGNTMYVSPPHQRVKLNLLHFRHSHGLI